MQLLLEINYGEIEMCEYNLIKVRQRKHLLKRNSIFESLSRDPPNIYVKCFKSISEIGEHLWNSANQQQDFYHSYKFLLCIEKSKIENCQLWYLLFYSGEKIIGSAVLSSFKVLLDLFVSKTLQKVSNIFRELFPNFLKINVLFCGLPISIGKNTLSIINSNYYKEILKSLVGQMQIIALENKINYLCLKEFREDEVIWLDVLDKLDFIKINSLPYVYMRVKWLNFYKYISSMRHNYRRQILQSMFGKSKNGPTIKNYDDSVTISNRVDTLYLFKPSQFDPSKFFNLYLQVMERAKTKLETLNEDFFINAFKMLDSDSLVLAVINNNTIKGAAYLILCSNEITFLLTGLDYSYNNHHKVLMNILYGIVKLAVDQKRKIIYLGQTSYDLKKRIGGSCVEEYFFLKCSNKIINLILTIFRPIIFPVLKTKTRRVFI